MNSCFIDLNVNRWDIEYLYIDLVLKTKWSLITQIYIMVLL